MEMVPEEVEAVGILRSGNPAAWKIYIGYIDKLLNFERDKCVTTNADKVPIHQGRARAFREVVEIEFKAETVYESRKGG